MKSHLREQHYTSKRRVTTSAMSVSRMEINLKVVVRLEKKGRAFEVLSDDGRLGHLLKELVPILWNLDRSVVLKW